MNFSKSFEISPEMRNILPGRRSRKPTRNFLAENISNVRHMQRQIEEARKAVQAEANKKVQKERRRKPFTVIATGNPTWKKYHPVSEESVSEKSMSASNKFSSSSAAVEDRNIGDHHVDQSIQTSPPKSPKRGNKKDDSDISTLNESRSRGSPRSQAKSVSPVKSLSNTKLLNKEIVEDSELSSVKEQAINKILKDNGVNFVKFNQRVECRRKLTQAKPNPIGLPPNYHLGELPRYLKNKKKNNQESKDVNYESNPEGIETSVDAERPGHILLSTEERLEHLKMINECYQALLLEFNQLPIRSDSLKSKQKRVELEKQLENLEKSIKLFSREKLYIKL